MPDKKPKKKTDQYAAENNAIANNMFNSMMGYGSGSMVSMGLPDCPK